jgi:hypothetical protein
MDFSNLTFLDQSYTTKGIPWRLNMPDYICDMVRFSSHLNEI